MNQLKNQKTVQNKINHIRQTGGINCPVIFRYHLLLLFIIPVMITVSACGNREVKKSDQTTGIEKSETTESTETNQKQITTELFSDEEENFEPAVPFNEDDFVIFSTKNGIYRFDGTTKEKISGLKNISRIIPYFKGYLLMSDKILLYSEDMKSFEHRTNGIRHELLKEKTDGKWINVSRIEDLRDLSIDPFNRKNMVLCSGRHLFYSTNSGKQWLTVDNPFRYSGIKSVALSSADGLMIYAGHAFRGFKRIKIDDENPEWKSVSANLPRVEGVTEEISDILITAVSNRQRIFAANNFTPGIWEWSEKSENWKPIIRQNTFGLMESMFTADQNTGQTALNYLSKTKINSIRLSDLSETEMVDEILLKIKEPFQSAVRIKNNKPSYAFCEAWLLNPPLESAYSLFADSKRGLYIHPSSLEKETDIRKWFDRVKDYGLNMVIIDMKDDYGVLRFKPETELLKKTAQYRNPVPLEKLKKIAEEKDIYLTARLVLFKDRNLFNYSDHLYALKDVESGEPWRGFTYRSDGSKKFFPEYWVDPYSENVWEYNTAIAEELVSRGIDEIQFDYVRFPTDGANLYQIRYPSKKEGMDRESALLSFFKYARSRIHAPLSIDIYGANGWYRTGARTGQDVVLLSDYIDVVCPMYYPSHFEQHFLNDEPVEKRPWRIYYYGTLRNRAIAREQKIIRPYVQAFSMPVSYDLKYYGPDYIRHQVLGVFDSDTSGFTFWNTRGNYQDLDETKEIYPDFFNFINTGGKQTVKELEE